MPPQSFFVLTYALAIFFAILLIAYSFGVGIPNWPILVPVAILLGWICSELTPFPPTRSVVKDQ